MLYAESPLDGGEGLGVEGVVAGASGGEMMVVGFGMGLDAAGVLDCCLIGLAITEARGEVGALIGVAIGVDVGALDEAAGTDAAGLDEDDEGPGCGTGAGAGDDPNPVTGLLPGSFDNIPKTFSLIGDCKTQLSEGSLTPPMRPGHLLIPELPVSQLSMIC